jgi:hypothetical protein
MNSSAAFASRKWNDATSSSPCKTRWTRVNEARTKGHRGQPETQTKYDTRALEMTVLPTNRARAPRTSIDRNSLNGGAGVRREKSVDVGMRALTLITIGDGAETHVASSPPRHVGLRRWG